MHLAAFRFGRELGYFYMAMGNLSTPWRAQAKTEAQTEDVNLVGSVWFSVGGQGVGIYFFYRSCDPLSPRFTLPHPCAMAGGCTMSHELHAAFYTYWLSHPTACFFQSRLTPSTIVLREFLQRSWLRHRTGWGFAGAMSFILSMQIIGKNSPRIIAIRQKINHENKELGQGFHMTASVLSPCLSTEAAKTTLFSGSHFPGPGTQDLETAEHDRPASFTGWLQRNSDAGSSVVWPGISANSSHMLNRMWECK